MTGFNKRAHDRHTLSLFMEVYEDNVRQEPLFKCRTNNIGIGGLMIHNQDQMLRKGVKVKVILKATCRSGLKEFPVDAKIVWQTAEAIGMQFSPLSEAEEKNFKRFLFESKVAVHSNSRKRWRETTNITAALVQTHNDEERLQSK
jgi:hypothetical protein